MSDIDACIKDPASETAVTTGAYAAPVASAPRLPVSAERMERWRQEEPALIRAWQDEASERALEVLLRRYQPLFRSEISRIFAGRTLSITHRADLEQEASLAFVTAVSKFDFDAGAQLATLASKYVRNALLRYSLDFRNSYRIGTGSDERKAYYAALSRRAEKIHKGESEVLTDADVASIHARTGASMSATKRAVDAIYATTTDVEAALDLQADKNEQVQSETDMSLNRAMELLAPYIVSLDARQRDIFDTFAQNGEIDTRVFADRYGVTPERIGQIRREMLTEMAKYLRARGIEADDLF